jgi:hypothetical protein
MLVVDAPEAAERLLRLAQIAVTHDDEAAVRDLLGHRPVSLDNGIGDGLEQRLERLQHLLGLAPRHRSPRPQLSLDQTRQLYRPALGRTGDVEPLAQLHLWDEQKHRGDD